MNVGSEPGGSSRHVLSTRLAALLVLLVGLLNVGSVLRPGLFRHVEFLTDVLPGAVVSASAAVSVAVGLLLIGLALNLGRGKRRAWRVTVALLVVELVLQLSAGHAILSAATLVLLALLVLSRHQFVGRSEPVGRSRALVIGAGLLAASTLLGFAAVSALDRHLGTGLSTTERLRATVAGFVGISSEVTTPETRQSDAVYYLLVALATTTVLVTGALVLRAPRAVSRRSEDDERDLRRLISRHGSPDSLAYFALRDDRPVVWGPGRRAAVSYRVVGGTMLAAGDPLGPPSEWPAAIEAFTARARENSLVPAVVACTAEGAEAWEKFGRMTALEFGDEAVLEAERYTLQGRAMRNVRQAVARAERAGLMVRCTRISQLPSDDVARLADLADEWRGAPVERGFSMALGRVDPGRDPASVLVVAEQDAQPRALLLLVPWGDDGLSLDLMRRADDAPSGVNELMITRLMAAAPDLGFSSVSLNFAVFREAIERSERIGAGPVTRLWGRVLRLVSRGTQVEALYRFNAKFEPEWRRRYLAYPSAGGLPRVTWAYLRAESFVPSPHFRVVPGSAPDRPSPSRAHDEQAQP